MTDSAATEAARALAARRPTETITCEVCGTTREAVRHRGRVNRFCSDACRDRARRERERRAADQGPAAAIRSMTRRSAARGRVSGMDALTIEREIWRMVPTSRRTSKRDRVDIVSEDGRYIAGYVWEPDARRILGALAHEQARIQQQQP